MKKKMTALFVLQLLQPIVGIMGFLSLAIWIPISSYIKAKQLGAPISFFLFYPPTVQLWIMSTGVGILCLILLILMLRSRR